MTGLSLYNGDCLEVMKDISDNYIDLIFCDLPYGQTSCKWDTCIDLDLFWKEIKRIRKKGCPMFFTTTTKFGINLINTNPKEFRYDLVWVKSAPAGFLSAKKMPMRKHEMIYVFYDKLPLYDLSSHSHKFIKDKDKNIEEIDDKYKNKGGLYSNISRNGLLKNEPHYDPPLPTSILEIKSTRGKHSTEKPTDLMKWILKYYSKEGDVILDPTMGSGSTGVACKEMKRQFIGIEQDKDIYLKAEDRLKKLFDLKIET
jgi:DNA modification methylase